MRLTANVVNFKVTMLQKGYSVKELAQVIGMDKTYLSSISNGRKSPSPRLAKRISKVLEKEVTDLFIIQKEEGRFIESNY